SFARCLLEVQFRVPVFVGSICFGSRVACLLQLCRGSVGLNGVHCVAAADEHSERKPHCHRHASVQPKAVPEVQGGSTPLHSRLFILASKATNGPKTASTALPR